MAHPGAQQHDGCRETAATGRTAHHQPQLRWLMALLRQNEEPASCPHCGDSRIYGWGRSNSCRRRHGCRGCGRTFSAATGTPVLGVHDTVKLQALVAEMLGGATRSCRALAAELEVGKNTIWRWRSKIMTSLNKLAAPTLERIVVSQLTIVRESRKASREWVRHASDPLTWPAPDRPRWIDVDSGRLPEPLPRAMFRVPMLALIDESNATHALLWPKQWPSGVTQPADMATSIDAAVLSPARSIHEESNRRHAHQSTITGRQLSDAREDCITVKPILPGEALRRFLRPFRGPATKHLRGYMAWFNAVQSGAAVRSLEQVLAIPLSIGPTRHGDMPIVPP